MRYNNSRQANAEFALLPLIPTMRSFAFSPAFSAGLFLWTLPISIPAAEYDSSIPISTCGMRRTQYIHAALYNTVVAASKSAAPSSTGRYLCDRVEGGASAD